MAARTLAALALDLHAVRRARRALAKSIRLRARAEALRASASRILNDLERREANRTPTVAGRTHP